MAWVKTVSVPPGNGYIHTEGTSDKVLVQFKKTSGKSTTIAAVVYGGIEEGTSTQGLTPLLAVELGPFLVDNYPVLRLYQVGTATLDFTVSENV